MREFIVESSFFGITLSAVTFFFFFILKEKLRIKNPLFNPLLLASVVIICFLLVSHIDFEVYNKSASVATYWLTPATISLAIPLYRQINKLKENLLARIISIGCGCIAHALILCVIAFFAHVDELLLRSALPKSVTTAIALALSEKVGGVTSVTIVCVTIAGISGAVIGPLVLKLFKIKEPVAQGLALGTASHAVGTSKAMELGDVQGAMGSLAIVVTGVLTVIVVPIVAAYI